jgi:hypothetical protein
MTVNKQPQKHIRCCFCFKPMEVIPTVGLAGHNAQPIRDGRCCDNCNLTVVIPARSLGREKK